MKPPAGHVKVYMRVDCDPEVCVGSARTVADVPALLQAVADEWHRKIVLADEARERYFAISDPDE